MLFISAKQGTNIDQVFDAIINRIKPPVEMSTSEEIASDEQNQDKNEKAINKETSEAFKAFLFDARFVPSRGVACLVKIMS